MNFVVESESYMDDWIRHINFIVFIWLFHILGEYSSDQWISSWYVYLWKYSGGSKGGSGIGTPPPFSFENFAKKVKITHLESETSPLNFKINERTPSPH